MNIYMRRWMNGIIAVIQNDRTLVWCVQMTTFVGIDPGLNGAFGVISGEHIYGAPIPTFWVTLKSGKRRRQYDPMAIRNFLEVRREAVVTLEEQFPFPGQGVVSQFTTGCGYCLFIGLLCGLDITTKIVHAKTWQKEFFERDKSKTTKEQALEEIKEIYPRIDLFASERSTKEHDGIVDAVLIAEYGRRREKGELLEK